MFPERPTARRAWPSTCRRHKRTRPWCGAPSTAARRSPRRRHPSLIRQCGRRRRAPARHLQTSDDVSRGSARTSPRHFLRGGRRAADPYTARSPRCPPPDRSCRLPLPLTCPRVESLAPCRPRGAVPRKKPRPDQRLRTTTRHQHRRATGSDPCGCPTMLTRGKKPTPSRRPLSRRSAPLKLPTFFGRMLNQRPWISRRRLLLISLLSCCLP
mmetsp:Transcript_14609/g.38655  ORF Transcript_14609/g.38655 Transcript_14609/m.38655 type:complete len:212 (-) Transcript_14609:551-1186(-)